MTGMLVEVERIVSRRTWGVILGCRIVGEEDGRKGARIQVKAARTALGGEPAVGERWAVTGPLLRTPWGPQIAAERAVRTLPSGMLLRTYLARHAPGVGPERADRLWRAYGTSLPEVLRAGDIAAIAAAMAPDRPVLGPRLAATVVRVWREAEAETRLLGWLQERGVDDVQVARRVGLILGTSAVERLERNPWTLVALMRWEDVDGLGIRLRREAGDALPEEDPDRLVGAVDAAIRDVIATGATAVADEELRARVARKLGIRRDARAVWEAVDLGSQHGAVVPRDEGGWRAPGCALMEEAVAERLRRMLAGEPGGLRPSPEAVGRSLRDFENLFGGLHPEQTAALTKVLASPVACLQGGAGVGKTHVARAVCEAWEDAGGTVLLAALAGKAASRLGRATGRLARTLHRTLGELDERAVRAAEIDDPDTEEERRNALEGRLAALAYIGPRTLVVVDEASMVDLATLHRLLRRMPEGARLLLIGDERQLPPVGFGLVFHRLVVDPAITARLNTIHRQSAGTGIPAAAASLRRSEMPEMRPFDGPRDGVHWVEASDPARIADAVASVAARLGLDGETMIVTPVNEGPAGTRAMNRRLHDARCQALNLPEMEGELGEVFSPGDPVLHRRNSYRNGLYNGSLGRVASIDPEGRRLVALFDEEEHEFDEMSLIDLGLGYALTCHRAQGSQAPRVVVALPPSRVLDPSWIYTAVTRAERQVVIVCAEATLREALQGDWAAERRMVGFRWSFPDSKA
jgi:exodeoxyribonuclease V alpha subunit